MKKSMLLGTLATASVATFGLAQNVEAQEINLNNDITNQEIIETEETTVPTEKDVQEAEKSLKEASEITQKTKQSLSEINHELDQVTTELDLAKNKQKELDGIDNNPEVIQESENTIKQLEQELAQNKDDQEKQINEQKIAQEEVQVKEKELDQVTTELENADKKIQEAKNKVTVLQEVIDDANRSKAEAEIKQLEEEISQTKANIQLAEKQVEEADNDDQQQSKLISDTEQKIGVAKNNLNQAKSNLVDSQNQLKEAETDLKSAQDELNKLKGAKSNQNVPVIKLTPEYIEGLKSWAIGDQTKEETAKLSDLSKELLKINTFKADVDPNATKYELVNLPASIREELSLFTANIYNQIRDQIGSGKAIVTEGSTQMAKEVTDRYTDSNINVWHSAGHNKEALNGGANAVGLSNNSITESIAVLLTSSVQPTMTLEEMKQEIYNSIMRFLVSDNEFYHAMGVANLTFFDNGIVKEPTYLGLDFSVTFNNNRFYPNLHVVETKSVFANNTSFNTNPIAEQNGSNESEHLKNSEAVLKTAQNKYSEAKELNQKNQDNVNRIQSQLDQLELTLHELKQNSSQKSIAQSHLAKQQEILQNKIDDLNKAIEYLKQFDLTSEERKNNLKLAQEKVLQLIEDRKPIQEKWELTSKKLEASKNKLVAINENIDTLKKEEEQKTVALSNAKDFHNKLINKDLLLTQTTEKIKELTTKHSVLKEKALTLNNQLITNQASQAEKEEHYINLKNKRLAYLKEKETEQKALQAQLAKDQARLQEYSNELKPSKSTILPETGEKERTFFLSGILTLTMGLITFLLPKRKEQN